MAKKSMKKKNVAKKPVKVTVLPEVSNRDKRVDMIILVAIVAIVALLLMFVLCPYCR